MSIFSHKIISNIPSILFPIIVGGILCYYTDFLPWKQGSEASRTWRKIDAILIKHDLSMEETGAISDISYRYQYDGKDYTGNRYSFALWRPLLSRAVFYPGKKIDCYVNPLFPTESVISTAYEPTYFLWIGLTCLILSIIQILCAFYKSFKDLNSESIQSNNSHKHLETQVDWTPMRAILGRAASFQTYKFLAGSHSQYMFIPTRSLWVLCIGMVMVGITMMSSYVFNFGWFETIWAFYVSLFLFFFSLSIVAAAKVTIFDQKTQACWCYMLITGFYKHAYTTYKSIKAIQLVHYEIAADSTTSSVFQINLVLNNYKRINIVNHNTPYEARKDAAILSSLLGGVPVLDGINEIEINI